MGRAEVQVEDWVGVCEAPGAAAPSCVRRGVSCPPPPINERERHRKERAGSSSCETRCCRPQSDREMNRRRRASVACCLLPTCVGPSPMLIEGLVTCTVAQPLVAAVLCALAVPPLPPRRPLPSQPGCSGGTARLVDEAEGGGRDGGGRGRALADALGLPFLRLCASPSVSSPAVVAATCTYARTHVQNLHAEGPPEAEGEHTRCGHTWLNISIHGPQCPTRISTDIYKDGHTGGDGEDAVYKGEGREASVQLGLFCKPRAPLLARRTLLHGTVAGLGRTPVKTSTAAAGARLCGSACGWVEGRYKGRGRRG